MSAAANCFLTEASFLLVRTLDRTRITRVKQVRRHKDKPTV